MQGEGKLEHKIAVPTSTWTKTAYRYSCVSISEYHDKLVFERALQAHQRLEEAKGKIRQVTGKGSKGKGKSKDKKAMQDLADQRKIVEGAKEELAAIIMATIGKIQGGTEEEKKVTVNSSQCHEGEGNSRRQVKVDITTTAKTAEKLRRTSGEKAIFQSTPGHDGEQKSKDRETEK